MAVSLQTSDDQANAGAIAALSHDVLDAVERGAAEVPAAGIAHLQIAAGQPVEAARSVAAVMQELAAAGDIDRARRWVPYLLLDMTHAVAHHDRSRIACSIHMYRRT